MISSGRGVRGEYAFPLKDGIGNRCRLACLAIGLGLNRGKVDARHEHRNELRSAVEFLAQDLMARKMIFEQDGIPQELMHLAHAFDRQNMVQSAAHDDSSRFNSCQLRSKFHFSANVLEIAAGIGQLPKKIAISIARHRIVPKLFAEDASSHAASNDGAEGVVNLMGRRLVLGLENALQAKRRLKSAL